MSSPVRSLLERFFKFKQNDGRIWLIDELRGLSIILMVLHHAAYDAVYMFGADLPVESVVVYILHVIFAALFVLISGASCRFSRSNLKRGALCFVCGMVITLVTGVVMPRSIVVFGILHLLGICMMLFALLQPALDKLSPPVGTAIFGVLSVLTFRVDRGFFGIPWLWEVRLPAALYSTEFLFPFGFPSENFFSGDYFPLLPWLFVFITGAYIGIYLKERRCPKFFFDLHSKPLALIGQNTLIIYMLHQPVIYALLYVFFKFILK
ncbi:MAG: DUF1624 domain-containing protein [Oscillospiraceae bacterium]|nr:DUF1624 domain-containing protein [Oscillospiraceae bacterium]MBQ9938286.1 DUF1624 domain-containing protein [Oscillospiraceae bacterium]